jgi:hypothetical protein
MLKALGSNSDRIPYIRVPLKKLNVAQRSNRKVFVCGTHRFIAVSFTVFRLGVYNTYFVHLIPAFGSMRLTVFAMSYSVIPMISKFPVEYIYIYSPTRYTMWSQ